MIAGLDEDIKISTGLGDIIKCSAEICKHEGATIYGDDEKGLDILFDILVKKDIFTYEEISIYLTDI